MRWALFVAVWILLAPTTLAAEASDRDVAGDNEDDATTQSVRDRGRILLKRNFLSSEFQMSEPLGFYQEAFLDAEGVDSRAFFGLQKPVQGKPSSDLTVSFTQQDKAGKYRLGGLLKAERMLGPITFSAQVARNASQRVIDQYEGRWRRTDGDLSFLSFPAYTRDRIAANSTVGNFRFDWNLGSDRSFTAEAALTRYRDSAFRTKIEAQFGAGSFDANDPRVISNGDTITDLSVDSAALRHYQHEWNTQRDIARYQLTYRQTLDVGLFEVRAYHADWRNSSQWLPWNFMTPEVAITYSTDDAFLPSISALEGGSLVDASQAIFRDYRFLNTETHDTDNAFAFDWDTQRDWAGGQFFLSIGGSWRTKKRSADDQRWVYQPSGNGVFSMAELVSQRQGDTILTNRFSLPPSINHGDARNSVSDPNNPRVLINEFLSFKESIEQQFLSTETVSAAYIHGEIVGSSFTASVGLREERTSTNTLGTLSGSGQSTAPVGSEPIAEVSIFGVSVVDTFDGFQAFRVPADNQYKQWIPSFEFRYNINDRLAFNLIWHEQLMRPQYFDIVNYSREMEAFRRIDKGNPTLAPARISTVSTGLRYRKADMTVWFELYEKSIDDFIYRSTVSGLVRGDIYRIRSIENGSRASISGVQVSADFSLPTAKLPIDEASLSLRYTYSDSEAQLPTRATTLPERARHFGNATLRIKKGQLSFDMRLVGHTETLESIGEDVWQDQFRSKVLSMSHSISYQARGSVRLNLSITNPLDRPERITERSEHRVVKNEFSGALYKLSISRPL